jgi:aminoglycoside/choline kinase family phosphotransferase
MTENTLEQLRSLFARWSGRTPEKVTDLPESGSARKYFRISAAGVSALGVYNPEKVENDAFVEFSRHFRANGLPVPEVYLYEPDENIYLVEDLGDEMLLNRIESLRNQGEEDAELELYERVVDYLPKFQAVGKNLNDEYFIGRKVFDKQSVMWDLNYFKYFALKISGVSFDEQKLEDDFQAFADYLQQVDKDYFMFRDFQSRNIMVKADQFYFIDFQGGRKGPLQYDLVSLLFEGKTHLSPEMRDHLLEHYLKTAEKVLDFDPDSFRKHFYAFAIIRTLQALAAYGLRGLHEKKPLFIQSIPHALENLKWLITEGWGDMQFLYLREILSRLIDHGPLQEEVEKHVRLTVTINSFSYKHGIPVDRSENGGGFVFDCRALPNPGRIEKYKLLTGKDEAVKNFLREKSEVTFFINNVAALVEQSVTKYSERKFTSLFVSFGCTGGQHRSVYAAETLAHYLKEHFDVNVVLHHRELEIKTRLNNA